MGHAAGLRAGTRYAFSRDFKKKASTPTDPPSHAEHDN
ncbi:unnamed protein product [Aureobasidium uvarum]|uniref:Uncharacterized protein n=1 Tax=Aureobasidium uvarum TaxID=2773716 RepID=A0A9N8KDB5_9PEZI|nr:unnamed protein product [Aureobasidium uvarum]